MLYSLLKPLGLAALAVAVCVGPVQAADPAESGDDLSLLCSTVWAEDEGGCCEEEVCAAVCDPCGCFQPGVFFAAEYFYWGVRRPNRPYAAVAQVEPILTFAGTDLSLERDAGFRLDAGYLTQGGWELDVEYTYYFNTAAAAITTAGVGAQVVATQAHPVIAFNLGGGVVPVDAASAAARMDYDVYDFNVGKRWEPALNLSVRAFGGVRFAQIDQESVIGYTAGANGALTSLINSGSSMNAWGVRTGGQLDWRINGSRLSLFSRGAVSLLAADIDTVRSEQGAWGGGATPAPYAYGLTKNCQSMVPVLEAAVGARWEQGPFDIAVGYELANWFGAATSIDFVDDQSIATVVVDRGDLGFDGFFVRLGFIY